MLDPTIRELTHYQLHHLAETVMFVPFSVLVGLPVLSCADACVPAPAAGSPLHVLFRPLLVSHEEGFPV